MIDLTREHLIEFARYNAGIQRARNADPAPRFVHVCPSEVCTDTTTCSVCRKRAARDLLVATNVEECAHLLMLLDRPEPPRGQPKTPITHGTERGYRKHLRRGENACRPCIEAANSADERRKKGERP